MGLDLCSSITGTGSLSPDNDTPQLHDNDDESRYGADGYDDDVLY